MFDNSAVLALATLDDKTILGSFSFAQSLRVANQGKYTMLSRSQLFRKTLPMQMSSYKLLIEIGRENLALCAKFLSVT